MKSLYSIFFLALSLLFLPSLSFAQDTVKYNAPKHRGLALDWCRIFEHGCGKPAADAYCRSKGHVKSSSWAKWNNPGVKTMTIGQNSVCDPRYHRCDSFKSINCVVKAKTFVKPKHNGYRLDWCRTFGSQCGQPVAYAFCRAKGYNSVVNFRKKNNSPVETMTIGENSICNSRYHRCDTFKSIKCR